MPELPEIYLFSQDMNKELVGKTVSGIEVTQPKSLNMPESEFVKAVSGATVRSVGYHGKWIQAELSHGWLLLNLGMGGDILLVDHNTLPEKYRLLFEFSDGTCLAIDFWWFGYVHWTADLATHRMSAKLGPNALDMDLEAFRGLLKGRRGAIKPFLLNQSRIAGMGNVTVQDPLFRAKIHPLRPINTLTSEEVEALHGAIQHLLHQAIEKGGSYWERNLYGEKGSWDKSYFAVAYNEGQPCPVCETGVEKIKTGSTSGYICPQCQTL